MNPGSASPERSNHCFVASAQDRDSAQSRENHEALSLLDANLLLRQDRRCLTAYSPGSESSFEPSREAWKFSSDRGKRDCLAAIRLVTLTGARQKSSFSWLMFLSHPFSSKSTEGPFRTTALCRSARRVPHTSRLFAMC